VVVCGGRWRPPRARTAAVTATRARVPGRGGQRVARHPPQRRLAGGSCAGWGRCLGVWVGSWPCVLCGCTAGGRKQVLFSAHWWTHSPGKQVPAGVGHTNRKPTGILFLCERDGKKKKMMRRRSTGRYSARGASRGNAHSALCMTTVGHVSALVSILPSASFVAPYDRILIVWANVILEFDTPFDSAHRDLSNEAVSTSIWPKVTKLSSSAFLHISPRSQESGLTALLRGVSKRP